MLGLRQVLVKKLSRQVTIDFRKRSATLSSEPEKTVPWSQFGFVSLPTYASDRYELRLNLAKFGVQPGDTVKIGFTGSDELDESVSIVLQKGKERHPEVTFDRTNTGDIRIANLNTLQQGMSDVDRSGSIKRLLTAAKADIFCFQEEWEEAKFREAVPRMVPSDQRVNLHWSNGCGIATSLPLEQIPMQLDRGVAAMIELPESNPLVVVSIHLKCCGFAGSREDLTRVYQAQQLVDEIRKLRHGEYGDELKQAGIVILGDYNLVGSRKPLDILRNAGVTDKILLIAGDSAAFTWRGINPEESFWPGRLDIVTYDHVVLRLSNGFLVDTSKLSEKALRVLGVRVHDSKASDHLMLIADFQLLR